MNNNAGQGEPREAAVEASELPEPDRLETEDVNELFVAAYWARRAGFKRVQADPEHVEALCLEVLRSRAGAGSRSAHLTASALEALAEDSL